MGVRVLEGTYDGTEQAAVMVSSLNDEPLGPLWKGAEAVEQIEAFLDWMRREPWLAKVEEMGLGPVDIPPRGMETINDLPTDPRAWPDSGLRKLVAFWRANFLDADGFLIAAPVEG